MGSVGTRCLIVLLESADGAPLFLQVKEATGSVLEPYAGPSEFDHAGERVVEGQRLMQSASDVFLGWARAENAENPELDFYVRQLWDGKGSADIDEMGGGRLRRYAWFCGAALALAHARSGDAAMISGYIGEDETLDHALVSFADSYADLTEADHAILTDAIDAGTVQSLDDL